MDQDRADVELTIQIGAEDEQDIMGILTQARNRARALLARPDAAEIVHEDQWCAGTMRVTLRRPHFPTPETQQAAKDLAADAMGEIEG